MASLAPRSTSRFASGAIGSWRCLRESAWLGLRTFVAAPAIAALAVVPELAQHVAEVELGMFVDRAAFRALGSDPTRWAFGYVKIAGIVAAMLLSARFWATGSLRRALLPGWAALGRILVAIALLVGLGEGLNALADRAGSPVLAGVVMAVNWVTQALVLVMVAGALVGDWSEWRSRLAGRVPTAALLAGVTAALFVPLQALHMGNHLLAIGSAPWLLWPVLLFDSLLVGLMATGMGAALFVTYRAGPTWRGWTRDPRAVG